MKRGRSIYLVLVGLFAAWWLSGCGAAESTKVPFDPTPPVLSTPSVSREAGTNRVLVRVRAYDVGSGLSSVMVLAVTTGQTPVTVPMQPEPDADQYTATVPAGTVRLQVKATDRGGNETVSAEIRVPPPSPPF